MTDNKPLLEHQKQSLQLAIEEISTPIFSTNTLNTSDNQHFSRLSDVNSAKSQPNSENPEIRSETVVGNPALFVLCDNLFNYQLLIIFKQILSQIVNYNLME